MTFLLGYWRQIAAAIAVVALLGYTYHAGGSSPRAELAALKAASLVLQHQHEALIKGNDDDYRKSLADRDAYWASWMRGHPAKPVVKIASSLCGNKAADDRLSASLEQYLAGIGHVRSELASLLERADAQQAQLICAVDYAQKDAVIH